MRSNRPQSWGFSLATRWNFSLDSARLADVVREHCDTLLRRSDVERYRELDPANARLRALARELLEDGQHELLWVPPTVPYWELGAPFDQHPNFTKSLLFSAWKVVPDVVSTLLSYEAERLMLGESTDGGYRGLYRKQRGLLRFSRSKRRLTGMTALALQYPCLTLADEVDPVACFTERRDPRKHAEAVVRRLLRELPRGEGRVDDRWYWAAPALLDARLRPTHFLEGWRLAQPKSPHGDHLDAGAQGADEGKADDTRFDEHVEMLSRAAADELDLGTWPADLEEVLVELALGAPGVLAARSLRCTGADDEERQAGAALVAEGIRTLFNQPTAMAVVRRLHPRVPYWRATLRYAVDGGLAAVFDEHCHQLLEQTKWQELSASQRCHEVARQMGHAATVKVSRVTATELTPTDNGVETQAIRLRTSFALRYGSVIGDKDTAIAREGAVRAAFNSPYRPFVLASTSIGQEGLDFHPWCHSVVHWNLPGNPVDLEQREGRVHRYKGHAVRKNLAASMDRARLAERWEQGMDLWHLLFTLAVEQRAPGTNDLNPWWICEGPHRVRRVVPMLPYSKEHERLRRLKRDLVSYRLVFGQPRQQELLDQLQHANISPSTMDEWTLDLSPGAQ